MIRRILTPLIVFSFMLAFGISAQAQGDPPSDADLTAAQAVISAQMEAFKRDDGAAAFAFAAPGIKRVISSPEVFLEIVRTQYAPVYRASYVEFREAIEVQQQLMQKVFVVGEDNRAALAVYTLEEQGDGAWRISGCYLYPVPPEEQPL